MGQYLANEGGVPVRAKFTGGESLLTHHRILASVKEVNFLSKEIEAKSSHC